MKTVDSVIDLLKTYNNKSGKYHELEDAMIKFNEKVAKGEIIPRGNTLIKRTDSKVLYEASNIK